MLKNIFLHTYHKKNGFAEVSKNLAKSENNYVGLLKEMMLNKNNYKRSRFKYYDNTAKNCNSSSTNLSFLT